MFCSCLLYSQYFEFNTSSKVRMCFMKRVLYAFLEALQWQYPIAPLPAISSSPGLGTESWMSSSAALRLMNDYRACRENPPEGCSAAPVSDSNLFVWDAMISGPAETPWEGGLFSLRLSFSENYPDTPPQIRFTTEIFHPNVFTNGQICLDVIQNMWSPIFTVCPRHPFL